MPITHEQRRTRQRHLCASDSPVILGMSPYKKTAADIYWSKALPLEPEQPTAAMTVGNILESALLDYAGLQLGAEIQRDDLWRVARTGLGAGIFGAHLDGAVPGKPEAVECKYANAEYAQGYGDNGTDEVPDHVMIQVQHQMYAAGLERVWVVAALAGYSLDLRMYCVPRAESIIDTIVPFGVDWWRRYVEAGVAPNGDAPPMAVLKAIRREPESVCELPADAVALADLYVYLGGKEKEHEAEREQVKAKLIHLLGDAEAGRLPDGRLVHFKPIERKYFNQKQLEIDHPELAAGYRESRVSRTLYIKKK